MKLAKDDLVAALRLRYDYYSAETMYESARTRAGLAEQPTYDPGELAAFRAALAAVGDRLAAVDARLDHLIGAPTAAAGGRPSASEVEPAAVGKASAAGKPSAAEAEPAAGGKTIAAEAESAAGGKTIAAEAERAAGGKASAAEAESAAGGKAIAAEAEPAAAGKSAAPAPAPSSDAAVDPAAKPARAKSSGDTRPRPVTPASGITAPAVETTITLTGVEVAKGEQVLVCGGLAALGDWDPTRARPMTRKGDRWLATIEIAAGTQATFKFVRCAADGSAVWEDGDDRNLSAGSSIDATWQ